MVKGIAHVCFIVNDLEESIKFFTDVLGFRHGFDFRNEKSERTGVYLHAGERTFIEMFKGEAKTCDEKCSYGHICLEVDDINKTVADIKSKGVEVGEIKLGKDGSYQAWLADPTGNKIELHQYTTDSLQVKALQKD